MVLGPASIFLKVRLDDEPHSVPVIGRSLFELPGYAPVRNRRRAIANTTVVLAS
jgi:hypothetical protein